MYSAIYIIYNPISTSGQAANKARRLAQKLERRHLGPVNLQMTQYAGHAESLAYQACLDSPKPLIISVSGDGGYNEVVNGVMRAQRQDPSRQPVCAILPAGNANDHRRSVRKHPLSWAIAHTTPEPLDLLKITIQTKDQAQVRYAHSYIGVGVTSHIAAAFKNQTLGPIKEVVIAIKAIFNFHPVAISTTDGKTRRYDSLIFANIHHMAKFMRVGNKTDINNGSFRVAAIPYRSQFWLLRFALNFWLFVFGLKRLPQQTKFIFGVPRSESIHLDGEIMQLPKETKVTVSMAVGGLLTIR